MMTLLEFVRKLQTPDGRIECAATYGGCLEYIEKMEAQNREIASADLDEARRLVESLNKTIFQLESEKSDLWKRMEAAQLTAKMINSENDTMRNYENSKTEIMFDLELENKELKDKMELTMRQFADTVRSQNDLASRLATIGNMPPTVVKESFPLMPKPWPPGSLPLVIGGGGAGETEWDRLRKRSEEISNEIKDRMNRNPRDIPNT